MQVSATLEYEVGQDQEVEDESDEDAVSIRRVHPSLFFFFFCSL